MKTFFKISAITCFLFLFACGSGNVRDPKGEDFFVGTYEGQVNYTNKDGDKESHEDAKITVVKVASKSNYNFEFNKGVSNLNNVEFEEKSGHHLTNKDNTEGKQAIDIDGDHLTMDYTEDDETWEVDAKRQD